MLFGPDGKPLYVHREDNERPVITFVITKDRKQFAWFCKKLGVKPEIDNVHHLTSPRQLIGIDTGVYDVEFKHWGDYSRSPVDSPEWKRELERMMAQHGETETPFDHRKTDEVELAHDAREIEDKIDKGRFN